MRMNIAAALFAVLCLLAPLTSVSAETLREDALKLKLNGVFLIYSKGTMPYVDGNNRTLVPLRVFADVLNGEIKWNNSAKTVALTSAALTITATLNEKKAIINGEGVKLDSSITNKNGTIMVPAKWVADGLGASIDWDKEYQVVSLRDERFFQQGPLARMNNEQHVDTQFNANIIPMSISYDDKDGEELMKLTIFNNAEHVYQQTELQDHLLVFIDSKNVIEEGTRGETNSDRSDLRLIARIDSHKTYEYHLPVGRLDQQQLQIDVPQYAFIRFYKYS